LFVFPLFANFLVKDWFADDGFSSFVPAFLARPGTYGVAFRKASGKLEGRLASKTVFPWGSFVRCDSKHLHMFFHGKKDVLAQVAIIHSLKFNEWF